MIRLVIRTNRGDLVKRILILCIAVLITFGTMFSAFAAGSIDFRLNNSECDINRLIEVEVIASGNQKLSAVSFEFTYDKSMFEFRGTKSGDTTSIVKSNELDNCVKTIYLCADGLDINNGKTIFTITFKAVKGGTGYIDFSVYDCIDQNLGFIDVSSCTSAKITVNTSSGNQEITDKNSLKSSGNHNDKSSASKSKSTRDDTTKAQATVDDLGTVNPINDNKINYIVLGIFSGFGIVCILLIMFLIGRKTANIKSRNNKSS